jgi:hypothetical protein
MSGKPGRSGRRKGARKAFETDSDRYIIYMADGLLVDPQMRFEHAVMFSIYFHQQDKVVLPKNPLMSRRRLRLSQDVQQKLSEGWILQQWGPETAPNRDVIGGQVDRIRKKMKRVERDEEARRRRHYMRIAWASILHAPNENLVHLCVEQAGETDYFVHKMLPFVIDLVGAFGADSPMP